MGKTSIEWTDESWLIVNGCRRGTGESRLWEPDLDMPLRLRKPSRIFVADMGDLFYEGVPDAVVRRG